MTFTEFKTKAEIETGFKCYEDTSNNQATFYGTSDKFEAFKTLAAGVILPTGTLAYLMDTGVNKIYSAYKKSSTAVDVVVNNYEFTETSSLKLILGKDVTPGDIFEFKGYDVINPRDYETRGVWYLVPFAKDGTSLSPTIYSIPTATGGSKTYAITDTISGKEIDHFVLNVAFQKNLKLTKFNLTRPTYPGTWY